MATLRILLAGTNSYRWRSYLEHLQADDLDARLVFSGLDCVAELREFHPDVLVLDPNLPWGGGDGVLAIRDEDVNLGDTQVMVLAANCERSLLYRIADYVIDDFVWQPISPANLEERLNHLLQREPEPDIVLSR